MPIPKDILAYHAAQSPANKRICDALAKAIDADLPDAERKVWHAHPVWFLSGNPIVGYSKLKDVIRLMFWSGQSFDEPDLAAEPPGTKFRSAGIRFTSADEINSKDLRRWLKKSIEIQWDYKNIVKRRGELIRLQRAVLRVVTGRRRTTALICVGGVAAAASYHGLYSPCPSTCW